MQQNEKNEYTDFNADSSDETLIEVIDAWVEESQPYHDYLLQSQNKAVRYYEGNQTDMQDIPAYQSPTVFNRIFEATETIVPIITATAHQFVALPGNNTEISLKLAETVQMWLSQKFDELEVQGKLEDVTRDMILKHFGVLEYFWDKDTDDINIRSVDPRS